MFARTHGSHCSFTEYERTACTSVANEDRERINLTEIFRYAAERRATQGLRPETGLRTSLR